MPQNIGDNRISADGIARITMADAERLSKYRVKPGDIVYSRRGDVERRALVRDSEDGWLCGTGCLRVRLGDGPVDPIFAAFYLGAAETREWIVRHAHGATMPNLNTSILSACPIIVPPLHEQRAIAATLGALDDKIELNRKMNATLEAMARALFRDWFVDFGPTRAKMAQSASGAKTANDARAPTLSPDLWSLFPDRLDDEGKPEGWEVRPVGDFSELKGGKQLEKEHITDTGPVPVFGGAGLMGYTANHNADGFVISVGRVGAYCGQFFSHRGKAWINNNASLIRPNADVSGEWLLIALRHIDMDVIKKGAAQPFVSNGDIAKVGIVWPGDAIIKAFADALVSLMKKSEANERESRTLAQTRDLLLPRLMSGALRVAGAERRLENIV